MPGSVNPAVLRCLSEQISDCAVRPRVLTSDGHAHAMHLAPDRAKGRPQRNSEIIEVLWQRGAELDVSPRWPVYRPETGRCYFIGVEPNHKMLYSLEREKPRPRSQSTPRDKTSSSGTPRSSPTAHSPSPPTADISSSNPTGDSIHVPRQ